MLVAELGWPIHNYMPSTNLIPANQRLEFLKTIAPILSSIDTTEGFPNIERPLRAILGMGSVATKKILDCGSKLGQCYGVDGVNFRMDWRDSFTEIINFFDVIYPASRNSFTFTEEKLFDIDERVNVILKLIIQKSIPSNLIEEMDNFLQTITPGKRQEAATHFVKMTNNELSSKKNSILLRFLTSHCEVDSCSIKMVNSISKLRELQSLDDGCWEHILLASEASEDMIGVAENAASFFPLIKCPNEVNEYDKVAKHLNNYGFSFTPHLRKKQEQLDKAFLAKKIEILTAARNLWFDKDGERKLANAKLLILEDGDGASYFRSNYTSCLKMLHKNDLDFGLFLLNDAYKYFLDIKNSYLNKVGYTFEYSSFLNIVESCPSEKRYSVLELSKKIFEHEKIPKRDVQHYQNIREILPGSFMETLVEVSPDIWELAFETAELYFGENLSAIESAKLVVDISRSIDTHGIRVAWILNFIIQSLGAEFFIELRTGENVWKQLEVVILEILKKYVEEEDFSLKGDLSRALSLVDKEIFSKARNKDNEKTLLPLYFLFKSIQRIAPEHRSDGMLTLQHCKSLYKSDINFFWNVEDQDPLDLIKDAAMSAKKFNKLISKICIEEQEVYKEKIFVTAKNLLDELELYSNEELSVDFDDLIDLVLELAKIQDDTRRKEVLDFVKKQVFSVDYQEDADPLYSVVCSIPAIHSIPTKLLDEAINFSQNFNNNLDLEDLNYIAAMAKWLPHQKREIAKNLAVEVIQKKDVTPIKPLTEMLAFLSNIPGAESLSEQLPNELLEEIFKLQILLDEKDEKQDGLA